MTGIWFAAVLMLLTSAACGAEPADSVAALRADADDNQEEIRAAIEAGLRLIGEACLVENRGQEQQYKEQLAEYWSDVRPAGDDLATRETDFRLRFPTPDPMEQAAIVGTAQALLDAGNSNVPTASLLARINYVPPTPNWDPTYSPLEERWNEIDICQARYGGSRAVDFGMEPITFHEAAIDGGHAVVHAEVSLWTEFALPNGTTERVSGTDEEVFTLQRQTGGWRITSQYYERSWRP